MWLGVYTVFVSVVSFEHTIVLQRKFKMTYANNESKREWSICLINVSTEYFNFFLNCLNYYALNEILTLLSFYP